MNEKTKSWAYTFHAFMEMWINPTPHIEFVLRSRLEATSQNDLIVQTWNVGIDFKAKSELKNTLKLKVFIADLNNCNYRVSCVFWSTQKSIKVKRMINQKLWFVFVHAWLKPKLIEFMIHTSSHFIDFSSHSEH